jgi:hypothetical protein
MGVNFGGDCWAVTRRSSVLTLAPKNQRDACFRHHRRTENLRISANTRICYEQIEDRTFALPLTNPFW